MPRPVELPVQPMNPVKLRLTTLHDCLDQLKQAKASQDQTGYPGAGRGVWISMPLWRSVAQQLELQMAEVLEWEKLLLSSRQELQAAQQTAAQFEKALAEQEQAIQEKVVELQGETVQCKRTMEQKQAAWDRKQAELEAQADKLLEALKSREAVLLSNGQLEQQIRSLQEELAHSQAALRTTKAEAQELRKHLDHLQGDGSDGRAERDALTFRVRDLGLQLSNARAQLEAHRQQLAAQRRPNEQLMAESARLQADNARLVALLGATSEWRRLGRELAGQTLALTTDDGGSSQLPPVLGPCHYLPIEETLLHKGGVSSLYPPLQDRALDLAASGVSPEEWHWVPKQAVDAVMDAVVRVLPLAPEGPLLGMLLALNKIWRQREEVKLEALKSKHDAELRELHQLYRQRAPYEAVVGRTKLSDLKRQLRVQAAHAQHLAAKAKAGQAVDDSKMVLTLGLESVATLSKHVTALHRKAGKRDLLRKDAAHATCPTCLHDKAPPPVPQYSMDTNDIDQASAAYSTIPFPLARNVAPSPQRATSGDLPDVLPRVADPAARDTTPANADAVSELAPDPPSLSRQAPSSTGGEERQLQPSARPQVSKLTQQYEQQVLRFSLWDRNGATRVTARTHGGEEA
ncbi:hypothetical protein V8C86DRAFT_2583238 [Haematococcus lacustris]